MIWKSPSPRLEPILEEPYDSCEYVPLSIDEMSDEEICDYEEEFSIDMTDEEICEIYRRLGL